jgi:enamine deaminase RidA (YjgF/YER057c/UK114 family)
MMKRLLWSGGFVAVAALLAAMIANAGQPASRQDDFEKKLAEMGYQLPASSPSVGIYQRVVVVGNLAYLAGHIPRSVDGKILRGKVGEDVDLRSAQYAAQRSGLAMLSSLREELGSLNRVKRLVKTTGMVNCTADFVDQPKVINGCSQLFKDLFGEVKGVGARSAVGMSSLPAGAIVEIEAIFEVEPAGKL